MTDPVKGLGKVIETLRRQLASPSDTRKAGTSTDLGAILESAVRTAQGAHGRTRARVAALDPQDPGFHRKARRAFLQVVLAEEFGDETANDPGFFRLLDSLEATIDGDAALSRAFEELTKRLGDQSQ